MGVARPNQRRARPAASAAPEPAPPAAIEYAYIQGMSG